VQPPFGTYLALARELVELCMRHRTGGTVDALIALHEDPDVADYFDSDNDRQARHRRDRLIEALVRVLTDYYERHMEAPLRQSDQVADRFLFAFADDPSDPRDRRELLARLRCQPELRRNLEQLDDRAFELVCGRLLKLMGCETAGVTREAKDRGIDMLGRLPTLNGEQAGARRMALGSLYIVIVGQAKRYGPDKPIGPEEVRQITGTWELIRKARENGELESHLVELIESVGIRAQDAPLHMIVTTSRFTSPAIGEARSGGVVLIDGVQLTFALAHAGIGLQRAASGDWTAEPTLLESGSSHLTL
jgi:hypothetical protein